MKSDGFAKHLIIAGAATLALYIIGFSWIEHRRHVKGPWEIRFVTDAEGHLTLTLNQPALHISNITLSVADKTVTNRNVSALVRFDDVKAVPPAGELVYFDTTFLPGVLTFNLLGHEVEFMPRTMTIDKQEIPWVSGTNIVLSGEGKYRPNPKKKKPATTAPAPITSP